MLREMVVSGLSLQLDHMCRFPNKGLILLKSKQEESRFSPATRGNTPLRTGPSLDMQQAAGSSETAPAYFCQCPSPWEPGWLGLSLTRAAPQGIRQRGARGSGRETLQPQGGGTLSTSSPLPLTYALEKPGATFVI